MDAVNGDRTSGQRWFGGVSQTTGLQLCKIHKFSLSSLFKDIKQTAIIMGLNPSWLLIFHSLRTNHGW